MKRIMVDMENPIKSIRLGILSSPEIIEFMVPPRKAPAKNKNRQPQMPGSYPLSWLATSNANIIANAIGINPMIKPIT